MNADELKRQAAEAAVERLPSGGIIGVGTGSTVNHFIDAFAPHKGRFEGAVSSSEASTERMKKLGIPVFDLNSTGGLEVYVDGADESNKQLHLIKGGGGALTREKIVAAASKQFICIADESKLVDVLGKFPLPVEVIPFGAGQVVKKFEAKGYKPVLRLDANGEPVRTDENNYVVDLHLERIDHPQELAQDLITTVGVVEHGLFLNMVDQVIVGDPNGPRVMDNPNK
ncbi:MAG: ribose-5-phosphate isomerase RpiA [Gammaproteobacteria bacterium]|nr:ribose-5-phosphate isomerase RpiA [Gammaproteobacteria bacterium]